MYTTRMGVVLYLLLFTLFLGGAVFLAVYYILMLYSSIQGAPYVPTRTKELIDILTHADLKPGQRFLELGCGDGRVTRAAVRHFQVRGRAVDINGGLILWARIKTWLKRMPRIHFHVGNVKHMSFRDVDVIYMFLLPQLIQTFADRLAYEVKPDTVVISHGFSVPQWEQFLQHKRISRYFSTYYYKITKSD